MSCYDPFQQLYKGSREARHKFPPFDEQRNQGSENLKTSNSSEAPTTRGVQMYT